MPIERTSVPGLNSIMANPNVLGRRNNGLDPVVMQQGGLVGEASTLQNAGRGGDSMLVHMNPEEVGALNQLGDSGLGGLRNARMTINPQTGLPEMFQFSSLLPMIAGIAATAMGGGPLVAAAAAAGGSLGSDVIEDRPIDLGRALLSGVASYAGAGIAGEVGPAGVTLPAGEATALSTIGATGGPGALNPSTALLGQADAPAQLAAAQAAENAAATGMLGTTPGDIRYIPGSSPGFEGAFHPSTSVGMEQGVTVYDPALMDSIHGYGPVDPGAGGYSDVIASSEFPAVYADGTTPMSPEVVDLARNNPQAIDAALRGPGGTTPYSPQEVTRNIGRETWQNDVSGNLGRGMEKISPFEWEASKAGDIGLGEIAQPAMVAVGAGAGALPPEPWEPSAAPSRRSYAYDTSGMQDRSYEIDSPPEGYVPGEDPEWEYIRDTTPAVDFGGGLGSLGSEEPFTFLSEHGYRGRGDLPTVNANKGFKDLAMAASPAYALARGGTKGLLSHFNPAYMLAKGRYGLPDEEEETPASAELIHPLTREDEEERLRRISNYYQPGGREPMQRDRYAFPAQAGTEGLVVEEAVLRQLPPELAATTGIMDVSPQPAQDAVAERMGVTPSPDQPQNPEERAIFDQALLALQGVLDPVVAEQAVSEFIETFGPDAYRELVALVENDLDEGGIVKPANGETTVAMGDMQGPDMIPGNIVDPMTGERTANLNVGENEYIEPAPSLARRAMAAGMPPTPENGALVRGAEEDELKAMYG